MIEVIYKEDKEDQGTVQEPFSMPRNVRQIGLTNGDYRIYVEDYVYTFLSSLAEEEKAEGRGMAAVLTGEIQWTADMTCIFVKGAIAADSMDAAAEHIDFSEKVWQQLQDDKEQYFPEQEIVGWFFAQPQIAMEITELFVKVHLRHFGGEKILMLMDPGEREDAFFRYDGGTMAKLTGYYIYYEKNPEMLHYMERENNRHVHIVEQEDDRVVRNIRGIMEEKEKFRTKKKQKEVHMGYGIAAVTALIVVFAFVVLMQNQSALNQVKQQLNTIQTMNRSRPANQDKTIVETQKAKLTPCPSTVPPTQENTSVPSVSPTPVPSAPAQNGVAQ